MPANSAQRLPGHVASGAGSSQLNASNVIFKTEQIEVAAVTLHSCSNQFDRALNHVKFLLAGRHVFPFHSDFVG